MSDSYSPRFSTRIPVSSGTIDLSGIQSELNLTQTSTGLNADGSLPAFSGTNYINAASSIRAAEILLDSSLKTVSNSLTSEISRASTAEGIITGNLSAEVANRIAADNEFLHPFLLRR